MTKSRKRQKTDYHGVVFLESESVGGKPEKIFYIYYRKDGKQIEEKIGRSIRDNMTAAKANRIRTERIEGRQLPNTERRAAEEAAKQADEGRWTIDRIWTAYDSANSSRACAKGDTSFYTRHIGPLIGNKTPDELAETSIYDIRKRAEKKGLSAQTVKHILALLKRCLRWAVDEGNIEDPQHLKFKMPKVDNEKTEAMTADQLRAYLQALDEEPDQADAAFFRVMLLTGIRRTALLNIRWNDVDLDKGFLVLRGEVAKNDKTRTIPLATGALEILRSIPKQRSPYIWPGRDGGPREDFRRMGRRLRDKAGLPKDWRPCHMLRHTFASTLASSGVGIYELQKLLTHGSAAMTQRYAHLADDALRRAAAVADDVLVPKGDNVVELRAQSK